MTWFLDAGLFGLAFSLGGAAVFIWLWLAEKFNDVSLADQLADARICMKADDPEKEVLLARAERAKRRNIQASNDVIRYLNSHRPHIVKSKE